VIVPSEKLFNVFRLVRSASSELNENLFYQQKQQHEEEKLFVVDVKHYNCDTNKL
jgi:hypothetical protein